MVLGFNHNIRYKGEIFHVQTEDSGIANPHIITLLYREGTILASAKTSYADIIKADQLEAVVESIMKEQHKNMMRRLTAGEFDARIFGGAAPAPAPEPAQAAPQAAPAERAEAAPAKQEAPKPPKPQQPQQTLQTQQTKRNTPPAPPTTRSLDEVILDYLITGEDK